MGLEIDYVSAAGVTFPFYEAGKDIGAGMAGDLSPNFDLALEAGIGLVSVRSYQPSSRDITIPLLVRSADKVRLRAQLQTLLHAFYEGEGTLIARYGSRERKLTNVYYMTGMSEDGFENLDDINGALLDLTFRCPDPYWYDTTPVTDTWASGGVGSSFFPFFPLHLTASTVLDTRTVVNDGVKSWPVWTIGGPGDALSIENITTGKKMNFPTLSLVAGQVLVIDTRPGEKTIELDGVNAFEYLEPLYSQLFPLEQGNNQIRAAMNNATVATSVVLSCYLRYLSL